MSLYNLICNTNNYADIALTVAGLDDKNVGRFRDAYFTADENDKIIVEVFTRNGGGNRTCDKYYNDDSDECDLDDDFCCQGCIITNAKKLFPTFLRDEDSTFDSTYASMYFSILPEYQEEINKLIEENPGILDRETFEEKFNKLITAISSKKI